MSEVIYKYFEEGVVWCFVDAFFFRQKNLVTLEVTALTSVHCACKTKPQTDRITKNTVFVK